MLIVGAGTGLDLDFLPSNVHVTAIDVTPAMLKHLERRAAGTGRSVTARIMDARQLAFPDSSFDAVVMHLILAVMPEPEREITLRRIRGFLAGTAETSDGEFTLPMLTCVLRARRV